MVETHSQRSVDIDIVETQLPSTLGMNNSGVDIENSETTVRVRLPPLYQKKAKVILRLGRRSACRYVRETEQSLIQECERPQTYDKTLRTIAASDGDTVTLTGVEVACLWDAYIAAVQEMGMAQDGKSHYIVSTLIRADKALYLHERA